MIYVSEIDNIYVGSFIYSLAYIIFRNNLTVIFPSRPVSLNKTHVKHSDKHTEHLID